MLVWESQTFKSRYSNSFLFLSNTASVHFAVFPRLQTGAKTLALVSYVILNPSLGGIIAIISEIRERC